MLTESSSAIVIPLRSEIPPKPATFNGDLTNLPAALRSRTQEKRWVVWRWTWRPEQGRWDKPPLQAANPALYAKSNDPTTWGSYQDAVAAVMANGDPQDSETRSWRRFCASKNSARQQDSDFEL